MKRLASALAVALVATGLGACGGGGGGHDASKVIDQTFSGHKNVSSGKVEIGLTVKSSGTQSGSFDAKLSGPFEGHNKQLPKFNLTVSVSGSGSGQSISFTGGLLSTGNSAFVNYQGTSYQVDPNTFNQFKSQYESQAATPRGKSSNPFSRFGIHPQAWLTNLKDKGNESIGGADTIHIAGDADVGKLLDDLKRLIGAAGSIGRLPGGAALPSSAQLDLAKSAVKAARFDLWTGSSDRIVRKLTTTLTIQPPTGSRADLTFSITLSDINKPQTVTAPTGAKPLSALIAKLGLGALSGLAPAGGAPSGGPSTSQSSKYLECLQKANGSAAISACAKLLH